MAKSRYLILMIVAFMAAVAIADDKTDSSKILTGEVPVSCQSEIPKDSNSKIDAMLNNYREKKIKPFPWKMKYRGEILGKSVYNVSFPSAFKTDVPENNTVHCEYYQAAKNDKKQPAVIVLHILGGDFALSRIACNELSSKGINALLLKLPYYGPRRPAYSKHFMARLDSTKILTDFITQAIMDVRRAKAWLKTRPEVDPDRIGILGMSLGGLTSALACGVDKEFKRAAIIVGGGNLSYIICHAGTGTGHFKKQCRQQGVTEDDIISIMVPFEPLTYTSRLSNTQLMMINGDSDRIIPPSCAKAFAIPAKAYQVWYKGGHFNLIPAIYRVCAKVIEHFVGPDWTQPSVYFEAKGKPKAEKIKLSLPPRKAKS